jgi:hypothetical protein
MVSRSMLGIVTRFMYECISVDRYCRVCPGVSLLDEKEALSFFRLWVIAAWSTVQNCVFWFLSLILHTYKALCSYKRTWKCFLPFKFDKPHPLVIMVTIIYIYIYIYCGEGPRSRCYWRTAALRPIVQPCDEDNCIFFIFPSNGAPLEWQWQGKTEVLGEKSVPVPLCPPHITKPGSNPGLRGERPATNRLSHGTAGGMYKLWIRYKYSARTS